jgi:triacylglycerol lipase
MTSCKNDGYDILFWSIISVIVFILLFYLIIYITYKITINNFISKYNENFEQDCNALQPITYRNNVYIPIENGVYEKSLADALYDISINTTNAQCTNILPLPNPPTFTHQLRVEGISPINGNLTMYGYIFWNKNHNKVAFSFAGTEILSQVYSDLQIKQIAPTLLNGYKDGVLVHQGFYNIYLSIRNILWNWWNDNKSWVKTFYITGKSLGGALSIICGYDFANVFKELKCINKLPACNSQTGSNKIKNLPIQYSFASPRTGNVLFANIFNKRLKTTIRINNTEDIIPQLPPAKIDDYIYEQTKGSVPFTLALSSLLDNHTISYNNLPICSQVAPCFITN